MFAVCVGCSSSKSESKPAPDSKTETVKTEEVTTEAPEVATTEASISEKDSKVIEKFWDKGGKIRYFSTNTKVIQFEKVYFGKERKELFEAEMFEDSESKWVDSSSEKEAFTEIILFCYRCDEIAKNLSKGEDVIELSNQDKENFVKHEWNENEGVSIKDSKYIYDFGLDSYGDYFFGKTDVSSGDLLYLYTISEESLSAVNEFAEYCNELESKNK